MMKNTIGFLLVVILFTGTNQNLYGGKKNNKQKLVLFSINPKKKSSRIYQSSSLNPHHDSDSDSDYDSDYNPDYDSEEEEDDENITPPNITSKQPNHETKEKVIPAVTTGLAHLIRILHYKSKSPDRIKEVAILAGGTSIASLIFKTINQIRDSKFDIYALVNAIEICLAYRMYKRANFIADLNNLPGGSNSASQVIETALLLLGKGLEFRSSSTKS